MSAYTSYEKIIISCYENLVLSSLSSMIRCYIYKRLGFFNSPKTFSAFDYSRCLFYNINVF